ncbi:MAG: hypothetical protein JWM11_5432 [Planctomycetaceae bacterium]|nr:hypothetical protein [Planctomycetaceae bacterium]
MILTLLSVLPFEQHSFAFAEIELIGDCCAWRVKNFRVQDARFDNPDDDTLTWIDYMASVKIDTSLIQTLADGSHVIRLGTMEIWDGADLALLRETLVYLYHQLRSRDFGVDMSYVKYVPSGFFGMLYDWHDMNVRINLYSPQSQIMSMLWFRKFFHTVSEGVYQLNSAIHAAPTPAVTPAVTPAKQPATMPHLQRTV